MWSSSAPVRVIWKDLDTEVTEEICALMAFCRAPANQPVRDALGGQMYKLFVCLCLVLHLWSWWENAAHKLDVQQLFSERSI